MSTPLSGFYKKDGGLLYAPNFVDAPGFLLSRDEPADRDRTEDGWRWFDSRTAAEAFHSQEDPVAPA